MSENNSDVSNTEVLAGQDEAGWELLGVDTYVKIAIIAALFWYLFSEEIDRIVYRWVTDPSWSHGFLIPFFSLYFLNQHKSELVRLKAKPSYTGLFLMFCCIVFYPLTIKYFQIGYARSLTVVAMLGSTVLFLGGWQLVRRAWLAVLYLVFAVPLPIGIYKQITIPMRQLAARVATALLNLVPQLEAVVSGVVIDVTYKGVRMEPSLDVAEACSGMRLLMAFLALGVAMAYLHYRPIWQRIVLLAATIPIAIFCNIVRVTVTGFIHTFWDPKYAQGIWHDMLGMAMLPLAFGVYGLLAWLMANLFEEEHESVVERIIIRRGGKPSGN